MMGTMYQDLLCPFQVFAFVVFDERLVVIR